VTLMGKSRKEHLKRVLLLAEQVNARIFGIVLNGIPQGRSAGVYGYETYGYESDDRRYRKKARRKHSPAATEHELTSSGTTSA
jgi:Mrp family chromosome partitioning ATPase